MLRNRMLADPSFLFKVGTEVCEMIMDSFLWESLSFHSCAMLLLLSS